MDNNTFQWTDDLVKEFVKATFDRQNLQVLPLIDQFKKSKESKKEYEILSFKHNYEDYILATDGLYNRKNICCAARLNHLPPNSEIISVKRLSDGEIFTIGDFCEQGAIKKIFISSWTKEIYFDFNNGKTECTMRLVGLVKKNPILFLTEDGVQITDEIQPLFTLLTKANWQTGTDTLKRMNERSHVRSLNSAWKYFSTEKARAEYIRNNRPVFSVIDIESIGQSWLLGEDGEESRYCPYFSHKKLIDLAKSKL